MAMVSWSNAAHLDVLLNDVYYFTDVSINLLILNYVASMKFKTRIAIIRRILGINKFGILQ